MDNSLKFMNALAAYIQAGIGILGRSNAHDGTPRKRRKGKDRSFGPASSTSVRQLRRAFNKGWVPPQPTPKQMQKHDWYRRPGAAKS